MVWINSDFNRIALDNLQDYNPVTAPNITLLYGPAGVGKTELLHSCFQHLRKEIRVIYIDAQDFVKSYAFAAHEGTLSDYRRKIRSCSLLIFDHMEKLKGKKHSIEELLHTYETLSERDGKMIIAFEGKIPELKFLGEKLFSRILGGLTLPILSPTQSDMLEYLSQLSRQRYLIIEEEVLKQASFIIKNFREAQEFIEEFSRYADRLELALDVQSFSDYIAMKEEERYHHPTPDNIVRRVAELTGVDPELIWGDQRTVKVRDARQLAIYSIRTLCKLSYPEIGQYLNKAHSAILKSCQQFQIRMKKEPSWAEKYEKIRHYFILYN
jgi:chromosomal replication initiator protein